MEKHPESSFFFMYMWPLCSDLPVKLQNAVQTTAVLTLKLVRFRPLSCLCICCFLWPFKEPRCLLSAVVLVFVLDAKLLGGIVATCSPLDFKRWPLFPCWNWSLDMHSEAAGFCNTPRKPVRPTSVHQRCSYNIEPQRITSNNSVSFFFGSSDDASTPCYRNVLKRMEKGHLYKARPTQKPS